MTRRLLLSYLSLTALVLAVLELPLALLYARHERDTLLATARRDATAIAALAGESLERPESHDLDALASQYRTQTGTEVAVYDAAGRPIVNLDPSEPSERSADVFRVLARALSGHPATSTRADEDGPQLVAAVPIRPELTLLGAAVVAVPSSRTENRIHLAWAGLGAAAVGLLGLAALVGLWLARSLAAPLVGLQRAAERLGRGGLDARAPTGGPAEIAELADEFNAMADRLSQLVTAQRRFVADASHQLRAPLTALRLRMENLSAGAGEDLAADFEAAEAELQRLSRLVEGLLALSRAEGQRGDREPVAVVPVAADRRDTWAPLAEERGVSLTLEVRGHERRVLAGPGHLEQILDNLLSNAVEVSPPGTTISVIIDDEAMANTSAVAIHVLDQGPGMSAEDREHAFDRFWQGRDRQGGTGIGLAIVKQLVDADGGRATLDPSPDGGLDAVIVLPAG